MTEQQADDAHDLYLKIAKELQALVDQRVQGQPPEAEEYIRTLLTETMRFWKQ